MLGTLKKKVQKNVVVSALSNRLAKSHLVLGYFIYYYFQLCQYLLSGHQTFHTFQGRIKTLKVLKMSLFGAITEQVCEKI